MEDYKLYAKNTSLLKNIDLTTINIKDFYGFIYITINLINNKKYIGKKKFDSHWKVYLGSGIALKKALNKYGKENFNKIIIDLAKNKEEMNQKEIYYIEKFNAVSSIEFYNEIKGGTGGDTYSGKTEEEKKITSKKISNKIKGERHHMFGKHHSQESKNKIMMRIGKKVLCVEQNIIYNSTREAERKTGVKHEHIGLCCRGVYNTSGGFHWKYVNIMDGDKK